MPRQAEKLSGKIPTVRITERGSHTELYFPPLRALASTLMLALFGVSCTIIGAAATSGLLHSGHVPAASFLALAFAGVFALPLVALGLWFIVIAVWTAANSLKVDIDATGLHVTRRVCGYAFAQHHVRRDELRRLEVTLAPRYLRVFGRGRYYRIRAGAREGSILIADSLRGRAAAASICSVIAEKLQRPELAPKDVDKEDRAG